MGMSFFRRIAPSVHGAIDLGALRAEGFDPGEIIDFSSNQSPLGASPAVAAAVAAAVVDAYPDPRAGPFVAALAAHEGLGPEQVVAGNGSTELIRLIAQLTLAPGQIALSLAPSFGECEVGTRLAGGHFAEVRLTHAGPGAGFFCDEPALRAALVDLAPRLCWLCSPNNPTGAALPAPLIAALVADHPATLFVLDEAYRDLLAERQWLPELLEAGNLVVLRSMTKYWGLAGLRVGYALADATLAAPLRAAAPPWNVNACAQAAAVVSLEDADHHVRAVRELISERDRLAAALLARGWTVEPTTAGFFLIHVGDAAAVRRLLLKSGCLVRDCTSFGLPAHIRVSPRATDQNDRLLAAFDALPLPSGPR